MAVALTTVCPGSLERKLLRAKDRIEMYSETERLVRMHPEVSQVLHRAEVQYVSVRNALRGLSQRLLVNWLFVWMRDLMLAAVPAVDGSVTPLTEEQIKAQHRELDRIAEHYEQAASREAQIVYLGGMLSGVLALCAVTVPAGILLAASDVPVNMTAFFGCLIAGALGALVSVVTRMSADRFHVRHEVGRSYVQRVAAFRPFIGGIFGLLVYLAVEGGLIGQLQVPTDERNKFAFFLVLAFAAGFSERMVKEVLRSADGDEAATPPARKPDVEAPAPARPDA